jgi:hypothetical protein
VGDDFDDFGVEFAAEADFGAVGRFEAEGLSEFFGGLCDDDFRVLHRASP